MRRFDPEVYETNQNTLQPNLDSPVRRDPYFEKYTFDAFQELNKNPSVLFNFFLENNDILRKISKEDEDMLMEKMVERENKCGMTVIGTFLGILLYDKVALPAFYKGRENVPRFKNFRVLIFLFKYGFLPLLAGKLMDRHLFVEADFLNVADKYMFNYDDFSQAMNLFERAKLMGHLDELLEKRADFDMRKLDTAREGYGRLSI